MEMPLKPEPILLRDEPPLRGLNRLLANRQLWKNTIYSLAFITYLCSFLFFGLALADVRDTGGSMAAALALPDAPGPSLSSRPWFRDSVCPCCSPGCWSSSPGCRCRCRVTC